ncbi:DUF605-domain-containing protein [Hesseltinella vesiculosa]|uniref:DUF605-domain-containing protein n=1 Tax=Hesseltinella vesiculosa TaxID=101127 RepID=A0A1X2GPM3_9FUNG|nr:DUF605-domain-containing protein [Hesseltinella vesiculosa]
MDVPASLKYIAPFIQRGAELKDREPVMSYYALYYAVQLAMKRGPRSPENDAFLSQLLDGLEDSKKALGDNIEAVTNDDVGYAYIENFALKVFINADNEDRAGKGSKKTAKTFLAASIFLELLKTFGDLDAEVESKIKYAKWKAADIMKAIREGRQPHAGPPGTKDEDENLLDVPASDSSMHVEANDASPPAISDFPSPPSNFTASASPNTPSQTIDMPQPDAQAPPKDQPFQPPPAQNFSAPSHPSPTQSPQQPPPISPSISVNMPTTPMQPSQPVQPHPQQLPVYVAPPPPVVSSVGATEIATAQKNAKWAISALNYDDIATARKELLNALNQLGFHRDNNFGYTD